MLRRFLEDKTWLLSFAIVNAGGFLFGMYYYIYQLSVTSPLLWVFVIDCPLYVVLFAGICLALYRETDVPGWFLLLASVGLIKYGAWTVFTISLYLEHLLSVSFAVNAAMPFLHAGMVLEGVLLLPRIRARAWHLLPVTGWFLLNDWADYFLGTVPMLPETHMGLLALESFLATLILPPLVYLIGRGWRKNGRED